MYAKHVNNEKFQAAYKGDRDALNYCLVNYPQCRLDQTAFYILKTVDKQL